MNNLLTTFKIDTEKTSKTVKIVNASLKVKLLVTSQNIHCNLAASNNISNEVTQAKAVKKSSSKNKVRGSIRPWIPAPQTTNIKQHQRDAANSGSHS